MNKNSDLWSIYSEINEKIKIKEEPSSQEIPMYPFHL